MAVLVLEWTHPARAQPQDQDVIPPFVPGLPDELVAPVLLPFGMDYRPCAVFQRSHRTATNENRVQKLTQQFAAGDPVQNELLLENRDLLVAQVNLVKAISGFNQAIAALDQAVGYSPWLEYRN